MNFSSQNGVIWCILGVLFLRFTCPMDCSCMINFIEVPEVKQLSKYWGSVNTGRPLQVKYWGGGRDPCNPCGVDAYDRMHRMCLTFRGLCVLGTRPRCAKTAEPIVWWFWEGRHVWPDPRNHILKIESRSPTGRDTIEGRRCFLLLNYFGHLLSQVSRFVPKL